MWQTTIVPEKTHRLWHKSSQPTQRYHRKNTQRNYDSASLINIDLETKRAFFDHIGSDNPRTSPSTAWIVDLRDPELSSEGQASFSLIFRHLRARIAVLTASAHFSGRPYVDKEAPTGRVRLFISDWVSVNLEMHLRWGWDSEGFERYRHSGSDRLMDIFGRIAYFGYGTWSMTLSSDHH